MHTSAAELKAIERVAELEPLVTEVEHKLAALGAAIVRRDGAAIEAESAALQRALAQAVTACKHAAGNGGIPPQLRRRLMLASAQVAAQREALARATAALDRAIDLLLPGQAHDGLYAADGGAVRTTHGALRV
jgi:hypothetical protein